MRWLVVFLAAAGCGGDDDGAIGSDGGGPADGATIFDAAGPGGACTFGEECSAEAPICDGDSQTCTGCALDSTCGRFDALPFCRDGACVACAPAGSEAPDFCPPGQVCDGETGSCRACGTGAECDSGVCGLFDCIDEAYVLYVEPGGTTGGDCTRDAPCGRVQRAVQVAAGDRRVIHLAAGAYPEAVLLSELNTADVAGELTLLGEEGATISPATAGVAALRVRGGVALSVQRVTMAGATGAAGHGIECDGSTGDPPRYSSLSVRESVIHDNAGSGVTATRCLVSIDRSAVRASGGHGVDVDDSLVFVMRSELRDNGGIGLRATTCGESNEVSQVIASGNQAGGVVALCPVRIENSWIVQNGGAGSNVGGARLAGGAELRFTTVADNRAASGAAAAGVICEDSSWILSSIVRGNLGGAPALGDCLVSYSLVGPGPVPDGDNFAGDPAFVDPEAGNYDLGAGSAAIDRGTGSDGFDVHGDRRDFLPDVGGDEYHAP